MKYILFDIEATCWDGYHSNGIQEVIELGALALNHYGDVQDYFLEFVRPVINVRLSQYCRELTGIKQSEVESASNFEEVYDNFETWVEPGSDTWFVSWGDFDVRILNEECQRSMGENSMIQNHLDLRTAYATMKNVHPRISLMKALEYEEKDFEGEPHRALPDAKNMAYIFRSYFEYWKLE